MKKLFLMLASMLLSLSIFASKEVAPTAADLANYYEPGQLCVAVYFEAEICNDIVFIGTYNSWSEDVSTMTKFEPVDGFDGWYVVAVTDDSEDIQGKPIQLKSDGSFAWDYQTGDAASWTLVSGTVTISDGYAGEANLQGYDKSAPVVMISSYFKNHNDVCAPIPHHTYTVNLKAPICADAEGTYFAPAIIGDFNGWAEGVAMELNEETLAYSYTFEDEEGHSFKFKALGDTDWTNDIQLLVKNEETGEYAWQINPNITLGEIEVINIDYSAGRYALCAETGTHRLNNPIGADGRYIVKYDCAAGQFAAANDMEVDETFTFAVDVTGTWLETFLKGTPTVEGASRGIAFNKWTNYGDVNMETTRLKQINGNIWGMTVNYAQIFTNQSELTNNVLKTDSVLSVFGQIFGFEYTANDPSVGWWMWDGQEIATTVAPGTDCLFAFAPYTGTKTSPLFYGNDFEESMYGMSEKGYAAPCVMTETVPAIPGTTLPVQDFEEETATAQWTLLNGDQPNYWVIGNATAYQGAQSLYITNDGTSYGYNIEEYSAVWATLNSPIKGEVSISFDWKGQGESSYDYMQAYLLPVGTSVYAGNENIPNGAFLLASRFNGTTAWQHYQGCASLGETEYYLAFLWRNDASVGSTPVAIDNVQVNGLGQTFHYTIQAGENGALFNGNLSGTHTATCSHPTHTIYDICAFPYYGYKFTGWSDGIADQCRSITINRDTTITAIFEPAGQVNLLVGIANGCDSMGSVNGSGTYYEQSWASIEATPNTGYHFVEWSDGNPNAQRDIYLTSDTTLFATFAPGYFGGKCGEHLYWNITNDTLFITGTGAMDIDNYTTWHNSTYDGYYISFHISDIVFPDGLTSIPAQAFYNYHVYNGYVMETVVIPASVEYIGHHAFASCNNLKKWQYLGNNLELGYSVDDNWNNCILANNSGNIQFLQGPAALINECGNNYSWYSLDTLIITNGYYSIYKYTNQSYYDASKSSSDGYYYGYYRSDLLPYRTFFFPEDVVEIGDFALMNARYLGGVTIPAGVTRIGESAFEECRSLDSVVFAGNNLETIGDWAFYNCHDLKKINLPEGVQEVGKAAFFNCTYLSELTIPSTMQRIADNGFGACAKMQRMYVNALIPPVIDEKTFEDVNRSIPVFVPKGTLERYRGDRYWSEFFNITEYNAPTGILNASTQGEDNTRKVLRNGQVLIIRGDQTYTVLGDKL